MLRLDCAANEISIRSEAKKRAPLPNRHLFNAKYVPFAPGTDTDESYHLDGSSIAARTVVC